jgi:hypothetical protein
MVSYIAIRSVLKRSKKQPQTPSPIKHPCLPRARDVPFSYGVSCVGAKITERGQLMRYFCDKLNPLPPGHRSRADQHAAHGPTTRKDPNQGPLLLKRVCDEARNFRAMFWWQLDAKKHQAKEHGKDGGVALQGDAMTPPPIVRATAPGHCRMCGLIVGLMLMRMGSDKWPPPPPPPKKTAINLVVPI